MFHLVQFAPGLTININVTAVTFKELSCVLTQRLRPLLDSMGTALTNHNLMSAHCNHLAPVYYRTLPMLMEQRL